MAYGPFEITKNRNIGYYHVDGDPTWTPVNSNYYYSKTYFPEGQGGHFGYPHFPPTKDVGGTFLLVKAERKNGVIPNMKMRGYGPYSNHHYHGDLILNLDGVGFPPNYRGEDHGAEAYNKLKPTRPEMNLLNSLYELKDIPGMLKMRMEANGLHNIGNLYLAEKFGWMPLLSDIRNFVTLHRRAQNRLKWLIRNESKAISRKKVIAESSTMLGQYDGGGYFPSPPLVSYFHHANPTSRIVDMQRQRVWASARFRYWLPPGPRDIAWTHKMLNRLYGLNPTPSVIYRAIPWSWLVDWFVGLGTLIENLEPGVANRLAADYFYIMAETRIERTCTNNVFPNLEDGSWTTVTGTSTYTTSCKSRLKGNPFGFTTPSSLSGTQLAILGALGLSRL